MASRSFKPTDVPNSPFIPILSVPEDLLGPLMSQQGLPLI